MKIFNSIYFIALFTFFSGHLLASDHDGPIPFNKVPDSFVHMKEYTLDPDAEAVILSHTGKSEFKHTEKDGFYIQYKIHKVIKVLTKAGTDQANIEIPYYVFTKSKENVFSIKGFVYNDDNGKIVKTKISKEHIFDEAISKTYRKKIISAPNVSEGSVIEISYEISSDLFNYFREWEFQSRIPTRWSEYAVTYPEYFSYAQINQGFVPYKKQQNNIGNGTIFIQSQNSNGMESVNFQTTELYWLAQNTPALRSEPYVDNPFSYATKVEFQLKWVQFPRSLRQDVAASWESMGEELLKDEDFGKQLDKDRFSKKIVEAITQNLTTQEEKVSAIVTHLNDKVKWNGRQGIYATKALEQIYKDGSGNVADMNLLLIQFLRTAGIESHPIISTTRDNGFLNPSNPVMYKLNHVSAWVHINGKESVMDITDGALPIGFLPIHMINQRGWLVSGLNSKWVSLSNGTPNSVIKLYNLKIENGEVLVEVKNSLHGYLGTSKKKKLFIKGDEKYKEELEEEYSNWEISDIEWTNQTDRNEKLTEQYKLKGNTVMDVQGDLIYLSPLLDNYLNDNPFKLEKRIFPIDFIYTQKRMNIITIAIPEGYGVEELPKSMTTNLPDKGLNYTYRCGISPNNKDIQISLSYQVNETLYAPEHYDHIRQFFEFISTKQKELIVLKKI